jgi:hypothetical protein
VNKEGRGKEREREKKERWRTHGVVRREKKKKLQSFIVIFPSIV